MVVNKLEGIMVTAKSLRYKENLYKIPDDKPGYYKWWALESDLRKLLDSKYINGEYFNSLLPYLTWREIDGKKYYYIYVGVAIKESIRARLDWHVNQHHTKVSVESGFLSTLRQTISSLISGNQYNEEITNDFIDELVIEYYSNNCKIKSDKAKMKIEKFEKNELENNVLPLNLRDNKRIEAKDFLRELKAARKNGKINGTK